MEIAENKKFISYSGNKKRNLQRGDYRDRGRNRNSSQYDIRTDTREI